MVYIYGAIEKWFVNTIGKRFHVEFLAFAHWFIPTGISQIKYNYISVYQDRYAPSTVAKYLDNAIVKASTKFYKANFPSDMILTKDDISNGD